MQEQQLRAFLEGNQVVIRTNPPISRFIMSVHEAQELADRLSLLVHQATEAAEVASK